MTILITGADPNRPDAERCIAWLLDYYTRQAPVDGLCVEKINSAVGGLVAARNELRALSGEVVPWLLTQRR